MLEGSKCYRKKKTYSRLGVWVTLGVDSLHLMRGKELSGDMKEMKM